MKYINTFLVCIYFCQMLCGQVSYSENFDTYAVGVGISTVSSDWEIVVQDAVISSERSTSGSNSLFFNESKDVNLILPDTYNSGTFTFNCQAYINFPNQNPQEYAGFYFGFQDSDQFQSFRNLTHIRSDNIVFNYDIREEDRGSLTRIPDMQGRWFDYRVEIDLSNNVWNYFIDGTCISSIPNTRPSIAKCMFWGENVEVWIDNVEYTYDPIPLDIVYTNDAAIRYGQYQYHDITDEPFYELGEVTNNGTSTINTLDLRFYYGEDVYDITLDNMNLLSGKTMPIVPDFDILYKQGKYESALEVIAVNGLEDEFECNNAFSYYAVGYTVHPDKKVLVEAAVGTWCGLCLSNVYYKDLFEEQYPERIVGVEFHSDDVMELEDYLLSSFTSGGNDFKMDHSAPRIVDGTIGGYGWQEQFMIRLSSPPSALLDISATKLADKTVEFSIDLEALQPILDVREIFVMVKQKSVTGTTPDYDQDNSFYSGNEVYPFGGYDMFPPIIPANQMVYSDVPRVLLTDIKGDRLLQNDLAIGERANIKIEHTFDQDLEFDDLYVVVAILDRDEFASNTEEASFRELGLVLDDLDGDGFASNVDCDDNNPNVYPGADELCNNLDDNCDGNVDESITLVPYYLDNDNDGYGDDNNSVDDCMLPDGYVEIGGDCNDNDAAINPDATELCNNLDDNCDGNVDESITLVSYYLDNDSDGYGDDNNSVDDCMLPDGYVEIGGDCNDNDAAINPDATELCNNLDDNCDGNVDESITLVSYYLDNDNDGYGDDNNSVDDCMLPDGYVEIGGDCDDNDAAINPDATELCNSLDDNCDGNVDESITLVSYYLDNDNDGYGDDNNSIDDCMLPDGYVEIGGDCDDNDAAINPDAVEIVNNGIDEDCNGNDQTTSTNSLSNKQFIIYPNPTRNVLHIDYSDIKNSRITMHNAEGKLVLVRDKTSLISVKQLDAGFYLLTIENLQTGIKYLEKIVVK